MGDAINDEDFLAVTLNSTNIDENKLENIPVSSRIITLYMIRQADSSNDWKIQALFGHDLKYVFEDIAPLTQPGNTFSRSEDVPHLYRLQLNVHLDDNGKLFLVHDNKHYFINTCLLRISQTLSLRPTLHYEGHTPYSLKADLSMRNQFLFDAIFAKCISVKSAPGGDISFWENLCIFSYFIISMKSYELFDTFLEQFITAAQEKERDFSYANLNQFFRCCRQYFSIIEYNCKQDSVAFKSLIRMLAPLAINRENMFYESEAARGFTSIILNILSKEILNLWSIVANDEWLSFFDGLVKICAVHMKMCQKFQKQSFDCFKLLSKLPDGIRRQDLAVKLLTLLNDLQYTLSKDEDVILYSLIGQDHLTLEHLGLATTLETYISYLTQFLLAHPEDMNTLQTRIQEQLDKILKEQHFSMELADIVFLLTYMNNQTKEGVDEKNQEATKLIKSIFETNKTLPNSILQKIHEKNHHILIDEFPYIRDIIFRYYHPYLLYDFDQQTYLSRMLIRRNDLQIDYFIVWFQFFLCESNPIWIDYKILINQWVNCFIHNRELFSNIIGKVDILIELWVAVAPNDHDRTIFFITYMIDRCFDQDNIFNLLKDSLHSIENVQFIQTFKKKFYTSEVETRKHCLHNMKNIGNPLFQLVNIDKQHNQQSILIKELIAHTVSSIEITRERMIKDTFEAPSQDTLIYAILFDTSLNKLPAYERIISYLISKWQNWKSNGGCTNDVTTWEGYSSGQKSIVHNIWTLVIETSGEKGSLEAVLDATRRDMLVKLETNDKIIACLNKYCQYGLDKNMYLSQMNDWQDRFQRDSVKAVEIPKQLLDIVPFAEKLNPLINVNCWQVFLNNKMATNIPRSEEEEEGNERCIEIISSLRYRLKSINETNLECLYRTTEMKTDNCLNILQETVLYFEQFHSKFRQICASLQNIPIRIILDLFLDIQHAENDLELLKPLLNPIDQQQLLSIVLFWINRTQILHICMGFQQLTSKFFITYDSNLFTDIRTITEHTTGKECNLIYEQYRKEIQEHFSDNVLTLISYHNSSSDLFEFLHSLTTDDIYNLQEAVNDWDETLVNTKTVFDFAIVKTFIDRSYETIRVQQQQQLKNTSFQLEILNNCFEEVLKNDQFKDLIKCLESSSLSLSSIKRIHLELTDKEQSKRRQIADILQKSTISFVYIGRHDTTFDVNVELPARQTTANDTKKRQKLILVDLSELRDRARLLEYSSNINKRNISQIESESEKERLRNFIRFATLIEFTIEHLTNLYTTGHSSVSNFLQNTKSFLCIDGKYDELEENNHMLTILLKDWEINLCHMYEIYTNLTYFSNDQFWEIEDYIYRRSSLSDPGYHLLKYINIKPESIVQPNEKPENPEKRLENLGQLLSQRQQRTNQPEENPKTKKCLLVETTSEGVLRAILSLFHLTDTLPSVCRIFYCHNRTNWIQIRAFIYRCFYSNSFHQLIRPELLSQSIQDQFVRLLRSLIEQRPNQMFRIGIVTTSVATEQQMINGLQSMQILTFLRDHELLNNDDFRTKLQDTIGDCQLITSRITGLGKSTLIRKEIELLKKKYVKFSVSGDYNVDILAKRLRSKYSELQSSAIHFDIGVVDNSQQLNEILYCLLLFRSFQFDQIAVAIPADTLIYIEIDASPQSTLNDIPIFRYIVKSKNINQIDWTALNIDKSEIQTVANYLQLIESKNIIQKNIDHKTFKKLDITICSRLIREHFLKNKDEEFITWTQLSIYIAVFYRLFTGFSCCGYFLVEYVPQRELRMDLIQTLLQCSNQFTSISVENVRKQQRSIETNQLTEFSNAIVRWDRIQPFIMILTATDEPLFVYKQITDIPHTLIDYFKQYYQRTREKHNITIETIFPEYNKLTHTDFFIKLVSLSKKYFNKSICSICFRQYEYQEKQCLKCPTKDLLIRPQTFDHNDVLKFQISISKKLQNEYVLTSDNFVKMLLIYMRVQTGIPVLIMGETGCGKTTLIRFLCEKILDDDLRVFRIHAGVDLEQIITTMKDCITQAEQCQTNNKRLWIFFDEFNTTSNIGLLKEIICERTLLGQLLPTNMVFLGACNPRRVKTLKIRLNDDAHIGLRKNRYELQERLWAGTNRHLLYTVVPIPETMLEYIWDYGHLNETTERTYITTILNSCDHLSSDSILLKLTVDLLVESQNHFRDVEDTSSVSLRDIARFCRLYNWFFHSLNERATTDGFKDKSNFSRRASFIALLFCYYFRLRSVALKQIYIDKMQQIIIKQYPQLEKIPHYLIENILQREQIQLIDEKMELPSGTAFNRALRDNIFVLFACIINRIPVFSCGKPGSSKSSAIQILISNLRGKNSKDPYFQTLPELVAVSFQGSQNCTSESIIKVFERASNYSQVKSKAELLPVIVFDEIGLAELSPHNPLKVLHAELEVENNQYGFVGISNWRLDASKMNRALYLSAPDPTLEDLELTGKTIATSMQSQPGGRTIQLDENIIKSLSRAYYNLYENLKDTQPDHENYFGLRDYYSLIKCIVREMMIMNNKGNLYEIIRQQLKTNFDGVLDGSSLLWQHFCQSINQEIFFNKYKCPSFDLLLDHTLNNRTGRYLMLIGDSESTIDYVERFIHINQQKRHIGVRTLVGSSFAGDLLSGNTYTEQYNYRVLMDVILYAETNITLIMRQMGHVYDNLYDLFNQNFAVSARKKYCRIALGPLYHPRCLVHDDFYCIVFIHKRDLDKCDPPFLNRFEKHLIDIKTLIHPQYKSITMELHNWLDTLLPKNIGKHFPLLQHLFVDYSEDQICNLVIETFEELNISLDNEDTNENRQHILNTCQTKLLRTSSFDLPLVLSLQSDPEKQQLIKQYYDIHQTISFTQLINDFLTNSLNNSPRIIYTYTQIYHKLNILPENVEEVKLSAFKTELELRNKIKQHYQTLSNIRLLLIRVDYHGEYQHILSLKHVLLNERTLTTNHNVWLIFHLQRNLLNRITNDVIFNNWSKDMIDDLNEHTFIPWNTLTNPSYFDLILQPEYILSECIFDDLIDKCLAKFRYTTKHKNNEHRINSRRHLIYKQLTQLNHNHNELHLRSIIENNLMILIQNSKASNNTRFNDWRVNLLTNGLTIAGSRSFNDAFQVTLSTFYEIYLLLLLTHFEQNNLIDAYCFLSNVNDSNIRKHLSKLWQKCFEKVKENLDYTIMNRDIIEIQLNFNIKLPCPTIEYENIRTIRRKLQQYDDEDNDLFDRIRFSIDQWENTSIYGEDFIKLILNDNQFFKDYFYDQITFHLNETNIHLSSKLTYMLLTSNSTRSFEEYAGVFLAQHTEFTDILRLFEIGLQLANEEEICFEIQKQFIKNPIGGIKSSKFYSLVIVNQQFYQLPPKVTNIEEKWLFKCQGDPMIETSLMNLIELILSSTIIDRVQSIEQITTTYSLIAHGIRRLPSYLVNNLEKLRSFISLLRCLTALLSDRDRALNSFKEVCRRGFDGKFVSCQAVHDFIGHLRDMIKAEESNVDENMISRTLVKLEVEFLKDWLADNGESYSDILVLMNKNDNELWQYSAKIFTYIDRKLDLLLTLKKNHGKLTTNEDYQQFNHSLESTNKLQRLVVNRFHMHLMRDAPGCEIDQQLINYYQYFEENLREIQNIDEINTIELISMIAWIKYYTQIYAFALNNDSQENVLHIIDQLLVNIDTRFCSTIKLFIFKQLLQISGLSLNILREQYVNRNILWIKPFLQCPRDQQAQNIRRNLLLPTPLVECQQEFQRTSEILNSSNNINDIKQLIMGCNRSQNFSYAFFMWFIQYYCRFLQPNVEVDSTFVQLIERDLSQELVECFTPLGHKYLVSLCSNFSNDSYFHFQVNMNVNEIHKRLIVLNIIAVFISFKSLPQTTLLSSILFNQKRQIPTNYIQHLSTICLPGLTVSDPVITQMMDVRAQVRDRLERGVIYPSGRFIFQCSKDCFWMFIFQNCGVPNDRHICPLCQKPIGAERYGVLIQRDPPQIKMPIDEGIRFINERINQYNQTTRFGYHNVKTAETSLIGEKPDHLDRPISFRFLHLLTHGLLLFLHDVNYLTVIDIQQHLKLTSSTHFRDHFEKDYELLVQSSTDNQQCYIWIYKLLNHLIQSDFNQFGTMNTNQLVFQIEIFIEQNLIFKHINSITNEITEYKQAYAKFIQDRDSKPSLENIIEELFEDENQYPFLNFFNVTTFHTSNPLEEFLSKIQTFPHGEKVYPVTTFLLKRFNEYINIQHLYPIIVFSNYLIQKFNYRIKRNDAAEKKISNYLRTDHDQQIFQQLYDDFLHAWYALDLKEIRYGCQTPKFELNVVKEKFADNTSIATLLLNTSRDESSLVLAATIKTLAELQNEIVNYFHNTIDHVTNTETKRKHVPLQSIRPENILHLDRNDLSEKLFNDSLVLNYHYGKSKDIIYDYEEIEMTLRNLISSLVLIDTDKLHFLNYQFELYGENTSLINDVRTRIKQQQLNKEERIKLQNLIERMNHDDILNYLGSLDYVFTYLRNSITENATDITTIQTFVEYHIHSYTCLNENILRRPPLSMIQLQYIIDLYEMIEENAFDRVLRAYVKKELVEETFTDEERQRVLQVFSRTTFEKDTIADTFKNIDNWISMLKRLMVRVLNAHVSLETPLQLYLERTDLWSDRVTDIDLETFQVDDDILLQHTYVILRGLEKKQESNGKISQQQKILEIQTAEGQRQKVQTWFETTTKSSTTPKVIAEKKKDKSKLRV